MGSISCVGSSPVLVVFVYKPPINNCTATEIKLTKFGVFWVQNSLMALPYLGVFYKCIV